MYRERETCEQKECCCKCWHQVEIVKHPWNEGAEFRGGMSEVIGHGCTCFREANDREAIIVFNDREHGLCECFTEKKLGEGKQ